jgi:hypothetical protein
MLVVKLKQRTKMVNYAERRLNAASAIAAGFDFGNGINVTKLKDLIATYDEQCVTHNNAAAVLEKLTLELKDTEASIETLADRLLDAVAATYGRSSSEYKLVGSIKKYPTKASKPKAKPEVAKLEILEGAIV